MRQPLLDICGFAAKELWVCAITSEYKVQWTALSGDHSFTIDKNTRGNEKKQKRSYLCLIDKQSYQDFAQFRLCSKLQICLPKVSLMHFYSHLLPFTRRQLCLSIQSCPRYTTGRRALPFNSSYLTSSSDSHCFSTTPNARSPHSVSFPYHSRPR